MTVEMNPNFLSSTLSAHLVEKAKEYESFRNLPKFSHVPMAVIHPSPKKVKRPSPSPTPDLTMSG